MENGEKPDDIIDDEVFQILRESLRQKLKKENKYRNVSSLKKAAKATLGEFFQCYKIFGYDLDGNVIEITQFNNKMEQSAIQNLFMQQVGEMMTGRVMGDIE